MSTSIQDDSHFAIRYGHMLINVTYHLENSHVSEPWVLLKNRDVIRYLCTLKKIDSK